MRLKFPWLKSLGLFLGHSRPSVRVFRGPSWSRGLLPLATNLNLSKCNATVPTASRPRHAWQESRTLSRAAPVWPRLSPTACGGLRARRLSRWGKNNSRGDERGEHATKARKCNPQYTRHVLHPYLSIWCLIFLILILTIRVTWNFRIILNLNITWLII
jgi:hypothetical protein